MFNRAASLMLGTLIVTVLFVGSSAQADTLTNITNQSAQSANDSVNWSQLGADATELGTGFLATSAFGVSTAGSFAGSTPTSLIATVCPASPCSWSKGTSGPSPFTVGDNLIWTADGENSGNGPVTITLGSNVSGAGALIQEDAPGQFTAEIQVFNGGTLLGSFSENSAAYGDANGDPIYIGVVDTSGANINKVVFSISSTTNTAGDVTDFAIDTVLLNNPSPIPTPAPTPIPRPTPTPMPTPTPAPTPGGKIALSANPELFPDAGLGVTPTHKNFLIQNLSAKHALVGNVGSPVGGGGSPFSIISGGGAFNIPPISMKKVSMLFTPTGVGLEKDSLLVTSNDKVLPSIVVHLKGTGKPGVLTTNLALFSNTLVFGSVKHGTMVTLSFKLKNIGVGAVAGNVPALSAPYTVTFGGGPFLLPPGTSKKVKVQFAPTTTGHQVVALPITIMAPGKPAAGIALTMRGKGT